MKESAVALTSPPLHPLGINYRRVEATGSIQSARDMLGGGCPGQVSSVCHRAAATATPSPYAVSPDDALARRLTNTDAQIFNPLTPTGAIWV